MNHLKTQKQLNESIELTDKEMRKILVKRGLCPVCQLPLKKESYGEDEAMYLECSQDSKHYSKYLGLWDDINE
jgi:hypothetical protein